MTWTILIAAGVLEVIWAFAMKQSDGFTRSAPTVITAVAMLASFALLSVSMRTLPLGTAYVVWTGIGAIGAFVVGIVVLGEPANAVRLGAASLIITGIVIMKVAGGR